MITYQYILTVYLIKSMRDVQTTNIGVKVNISLKIKKKSLNKLFIVYDVYVNRLNANVIIHYLPSYRSPIVILDYFTFKLSYLIIWIYIHINTIYLPIFWTNLSVLLRVSNVPIQVLLKLRSSQYTDMILFKKNQHINMKDMLWFFLTNS